MLSHPAWASDLQADHGAHHIRDHLILTGGHLACARDQTRGFKLDPSPDEVAFPTVVPGQTPYQKEQSGPLSRILQKNPDSGGCSRNWTPSTTGAWEGVMIGSGPRRPPGLARWAESYEVKCERRQEMRESRRLRPNVTTCRQVGRAWRTQQREQLQRARQLQFFRKRNLEAEKGQAQPLRASEQGHCRSAGQAAQVGPGGGEKCVLKVTIKQLSVTGTSPTAFPTQSRPPSSVHRDLADHCGALPPRDSPTRRPPKHHRGTQTKAEDTQPAIKNDASQQTNCGVAVLDKEIIQLSEYLKEALQRELVLKQKMVILQDLLSTLIQASDRSWKGQLNEDKLKGRLRSLENQLYACTQALPMWTTKPSLEVEPESTGKDKDWDLRDQLQKKTLQLQAKEQECTELHSELDSLSDEYLSCLQKLQDCREELNHSQQLPPTRQCGRWLPILMVVIAAALAVFLANKDSLTI
ncbi:TRAF3-interacting JNK-activating modulator [Fukomys damarensis]|uniref:TRAF3-interacting JNK-activating modulator n=1 Tax=Fukomys damarensis TaxID=885580 RepID=A0A091CPV7_FUKDA|nr:TRAF3-interacting JNK-activating modulator [Fukomys damarensis]